MYMSEGRYIRLAVCFFLLPLRIHPNISHTIPAPHIANTQQMPFDATSSDMSKTCIETTRFFDSLPESSAHPLSKEFPKELSIAEAALTREAIRRLPDPFMALYVNSETGAYGVFPQWPGGVKPRTASGFDAELGLEQIMSTAAQRSDVWHELFRNAKDLKWDKVLDAYEEELTRAKSITDGLRLTRDLRGPGLPTNTKKQSEFEKIDIKTFANPIHTLSDNRVTRYSAGASGPLLDQLASLQGKISSLRMDASAVKTHVDRTLDLDAKAWELLYRDPDELLSAPDTRYVTHWRANQEQFLNVLHGVRLERSYLDLRALNATRLSEFGWHFVPSESRGPTVPRTTADSQGKAVKSGSKKSGGSKATKSPRAQLSQHLVDGMFGKW